MAQCRANRTARFHAEPIRRAATVQSIGEPRDPRLGWTDEAARRLRDLGDVVAGRVSRLDRGWSTVLTSLDETPLLQREQLAKQITDDHKKWKPVVDGAGLGGQKQ